MANRFPIILDTDANELKEIPSGDTLDLSNNTITGLTGLSVTGTVEATAFTSSGTNILNQVVYDNILNRPGIPEDVADLSDETNIIPSDVADLTDNSELLGGRTRFITLDDTPDSFAGQAGRILKVNPEETALGFADSATEITGQAVIDALGYTPYNETNPDGYIVEADIDSGLIIAKLGFTPYNGDANPAGFITGITVTDVVNALGYTPYNGDTNSEGFFNEAADVTDAYGYTPYNAVTNALGFINDADGINDALGYTPYDGVTNSLNFLTPSNLTDTDIANALGYTPYDGTTNSENFINDAAGITTALGFAPYSDANPDGYITGINSADVTEALGFTPYNATNPDSFISTTTEINALYGYIPYDGVTNSQGFLQSESDTLASVTARDPSTTDSIAVGGLDAGSGTITTTGNINAGTAAIGSITTGTTSVIDGDTAGDTIRIGGTAALTLTSSSSITLQADLIGSDAFKSIGSSGVPLGNVHSSDANLGGFRLNQSTFSASGNMTITPGTNSRIIVNAGSLGLPPKTTTTRGNLSPSQGDMIYTEEVGAQFYDSDQTAWKNMGSRFFIDDTNNTPQFDGAYYGELLVFEGADGTHTVYIWVFDQTQGAQGLDFWAPLWETPP